MKVLGLIESSVVVVTVVLSSLILVTMSSCGVANIPGDKDDAKKSQSVSSESLKLTGDVSNKGYFLAPSQLAEANIPAELKDKVTLFNLTIQSGDTPVLGASIKVLDSIPVGCDMPISATIEPAVVPESAPDYETAPRLLGCSEPKVLETFAKDESSNFISIVIKKSAIITLQIDAEGFGTKYIQIEGKKANFLVMTIQMSAQYEDICTLAVPAAGAAPGGDLGAPVEAALFQAPCVEMGSGVSGGTISDIAVGAPAEIAEPKTQE